MVTAVDSGAIGAACDVEQTATEVTAATAIAIDTVFMLSSLDKSPFLRPYWSADEWQLNEIARSHQFNLNVSLDLNHCAVFKPDLVRMPAIGLASFAATNILSAMRQERTRLVFGVRRFVR